ncbi:MAG: exo-alpha-sialidase [Pirellulales bacterium]|nr:exo-alpha-sialidase [Pirellulales bacterium]
MRYLPLWIMPFALVPNFAIGQTSEGVGGVEVAVGEPFTISSSTGHYNFPTLHQLSDKELFAAIWASPDDSLSPEHCNVACVWTHDGGRTWEKPVVFRGPKTGGHSWIRRKNGTCLWLSYFCRPAGEKDLAKLTCNVGRSSDGRTYSWSTGTVSLPEPAKPWTKGNAYLMFARSILELDDGSLLATMYGQLEGDTKYRTILVRSTDGGDCWEYCSTVAYRPDAPGEGCCEPVVLRASAGDLFCVMRVNSGLPMWACRSKDEGRTWTRAEPMPDDAISVFPDAVLMSNGVLAVSCGRPGCHIVFSNDGSGLRWTPRTTIHKGTNTDAYTAIREVAPGRLLYVYHEAAGGQNTIRGVYVDVNRK